MSTHRCLAEEACRAGKTVDGERQPAMTEDPDTLCPVCHKHITGAIQQLPRDWAELRAVLGERTISSGPKIRSAPAPTIPINTRREALMAEIVDVADRAAAIVSDRLSTGQPASYKGRGHPAHQETSLRRSVALTAPNIDLLAAAPAESALVWAKPRRCAEHTELIDTAEADVRHIAETVPRGINAAHTLLAHVYAAAGDCDDCNGWSTYGQERQLIEQTGLDITLALVELHNQTRAELGKTRLRHRYQMPCPNCGADVGRDDGTTIVDCKKCESSWTEREYKFLVGLITQERLDVEIAKWLLAEAYSRLDDIQKRVDIARATGATLTLPGSGAIIADAISDVLQGHKPPDQRTIATDRKTAEQRQTDDDTWTWKHEPTYRPPRQRKRTNHTAVRHPGEHISPSSLTLMADIDIDAVLNGDARCRECNLIHAGDCP